MKKTLAFKTLWLSDLHLGSRNAKASLVLNFLDSSEFETLFLVGDIFDFKIRRSAWHWSVECENLITKIGELSRAGVKVVYLPGNHDELLRSFADGSIYGIDVVNEAEHITVNNTRFLVTHGDQFEQAAKTSNLRDTLGSYLYDVLMTIDRWCYWWLSASGHQHWSLAKTTKLKIPAVQKFFRKFSKVATSHAGDRGYDGVICGHTHNPEITCINNTWYCNTGDWVESCCGLVENLDGRLELIHYSGKKMVTTQTCSTGALRESTLRATSSTTSSL